MFRLLASAANLTFPDVAWCLFNADVFTCPISDAAKYRSLHGVPTWRYRYHGDFYNLRLTNDPDSGAWHGSELPILFKTAAESSGVPDTPAEQEYSDYLQMVWAAFAKDPRHGLDKYRFPDYSPYCKLHLLPLSSFPPVLILIPIKKQNLS